MKRSLAAVREEPRADMTPLIDVVFQILIFFLCTLHFRQLDGRLDAYLPRDAGARPGETRLDPIEVGLRVLDPGEPRDPRAPERPWSGVGPFERVGRRLAYTVGPRRCTDLETLGALLVELKRADPAYRVSLRAGEGTLQGDVVAVLDRVIDAGFEDVRIVATR